ncbi:unnamed protein product [Candidula unifasciata]|uniref:Uncharacterized protein n=1 Tax=Candidula unifasciata TaxID=100452 RepID=A0A8S3Z9A3_9EUPU|nr:unnamed protein product [Candidula unifasciata]
MCLNFSPVTSWRCPRKTTPVSHSQHFKSSPCFWIRLSLQLLLLTFTCSQRTAGLQYTSLQTLTRNLPGCYSKIHQNYKYDQTAIPIQKLRFLFRSEIYKLATPMFNDSVTFYFQDFSKSTTKPVRSGFYSFSKDTQTGGVRMRTFHINGSVLVSSACRTGQHVALSLDTMKRLAGKSWSFGECDMFWRRLADGTFVGITGQLCLGSLDQNQGRIGFSMTLTKDQLLLTEGWYRITKKLRLAEVKISYVLQKSQTPDVHKYGRHKSHNSDLQIITNEVLPPYHIQSPSISNGQFRNNTMESYRPITNKIHRGRNHLAKKHEWKRKKGTKKINLKSFLQILLALTSGHEVHFLIDLTLCSNLGNATGSRSSFSGRVKNFGYVKDTEDNNFRSGHIRFMTRKNSIGNQGAQLTVRYVTLLTDGRVKVDLYKTDPEQLFPSLMLTGSFQCRLNQGSLL